MHGEELKGGQPCGSGERAREGALPRLAPAPWGRQGLGGPTGFSVTPCVSIASRRPAYLVANITRRALHLPFLSHGTGCCYALGCTNCLLTCRSSSWRYMEQRLKTLFSLIADVLTNEPFKKHVATFALRRPLLLRAGRGGVGATCALARCCRLRRGWAAQQHACAAAAARKALTFLSPGRWCGADFKSLQSSGETLYKKFPQQTRRQT